MEKERRILETSAKLFGELGYKKTTVNLIAEKCQMGKGTFYLYYKSKEEILSAIIKNELLKVKDIADKITAEEKDFNMQISKFLKKIKEFRNEQVFIAKLVEEAKEENNIIVSKYIKKFNDYIIEELTKKINDSIKKGYIKECNSEFYAFLIYRTYMLLILEWENRFNKKLKEEEIYNLFENLFKKKEE